MEITRCLKCNMIYAPLCNCDLSEGQIEPKVNCGEFTAMWPNHPVIVCKKHAGGIIEIGKAIGLKVLLIPYLDGEKCINCLNEVKDS